MQAHIRNPMRTTPGVLATVAALGHAWDTKPAERKDATGTTVLVPRARGEAQASWASR